MAGPAAERPQTKQPSPGAFIFYRPQAGAKQQVSYNPEAWRILSLTAPVPDLSSRCGRWARLLDGGSDNKEPAGNGTPVSAGWLDFVQSGQRRYGVKGIVMSEGHYLFMIERIAPAGVDVALLTQQWHLNRRECEIIRLLLGDRSNKEMAHSLGLSENTIKGYLKLLTRKLGVTSRTGIVARLLSAGAPSLTA